MMMNNHEEILLKFDTTKINKIINLISKKSNKDISMYQLKFLSRRIYNRIQNLNLKSLDVYILYIQDNMHETNIFIDQLSIHVTEFFRDETPFNYLREVLLEKICNKYNMVNILCAPCSTGEEAYSLSIIYDQIKHKIKNIEIRIISIDIDKEAIHYLHLLFRMCFFLA